MTGDVIGRGWLPSSTGPFFRSKDGEENQRSGEKLQHVFSQNDGQHLLFLQFIFAGRASSPPPRSARAGREIARS